MFVLLIELESISWCSWNDYSSSAITWSQRQSGDDSRIKTFNSGDFTTSSDIRFVLLCWFHTLIFWNWSFPCVSLCFQPVSWPFEFSQQCSAVVKLILYEWAIVFGTGMLLCLISYSQVGFSFVGTWPVPILLHQINNPPIVFRYGPENSKFLADW